MQNKQFFQYWTRKESLLRVIGIGLNMNLNAVEILYSTAVFIKSRNGPLLISTRIIKSTTIAMNLTFPNSSK